MRSSCSFTHGKSLLHADVKSTLAVDIKSWAAVGKDVVTPNKRLRKGMASVPVKKKKVAVESEPGHIFGKCVVHSDVKSNLSADIKSAAAVGRDVVTSTKRLRSKTGMRSAPIKKKKVVVESESGHSAVQSELHADVKSELLAHVNLRRWSGKIWDF